MGEASLVLAGRVVDVSRTGITVGGKGERTLLQFKFVPVLTLKGVFSRESLSLTSDDIGIQGFSDAAPLEPGQLRLLILGRSSQGYAIQRQSSSLEQAVPLLRDSNDGLIETVKVLLAVNASRERPGKVVLLLEGLRKQRGPAVIPLLSALERRSLLAVQTSGVMEAIAPHLSDPSPAVREQAARTLHSLLQDDYLEQPKLREGAVKALAASLEMADSNFAPRVAAFETLGANRVQIRCDARNERSRRVAEGSGFVFEGRHRRDALALDGTLRDTLYFSMLREEYDTQRSDE